MLKITQEERKPVIFTKDMKAGDVGIIVETSIARYEGLVVISGGNAIYQLSGGFSYWGVKDTDLKVRLVDAELILTERA